MKQKIIYTLILLTLIAGCKVPSDSDNKSLTEPPNSNPSIQNETVKNKLDYNVQTIFKGPNDTETRAYLMLIMDSLGQNIDTIELTNCSVHDRKPPFYYIFENLIIYEDCEKYPNRLKIMNLENRNVVFNENGFIEIQRANKVSNSVDSLNNFLFFFSKQENIYDTFYINKLNLITLKYSRLDTIITSGDPMSGSPVLNELNSIERFIKISYEPKNHKDGGYLELRY